MSKPEESLQFVDVAERPKLISKIQHLIGEVWPAYALNALPHPDALPTDWMGIFLRWPQFQFALEDVRTQEIVACGNSAPLAWQGDPSTLSDEGWDWAMCSAQQDFVAGRKPKTLCGLSVTIATKHQGRGLSGRVIGHMKTIAAAHGLAQVIIPVRPTWKARYPLTDIDEYATWRGQGGLPFDPWLRIHERVGGRIAKTCRRAMRMAGPVASWERWLDMSLPGDGRYVGPGLLAPLIVDRERDVGLYTEPNVWVVHEVSHRPSSDALTG